MRDPSLVKHAKNMRATPTEPEQRMWFALRAKRLGGAKFRRQKVIGPYIVDFASRDPMLVIEVDGDSHSSQIDYDTERTAYLQTQGYRVIRFSNTDIMGNIEGVLSVVQTMIATPPLPSLSPDGERV